MSSVIERRSRIAAILVIHSARGTVIHRRAKTMNRLVSIATLITLAACASSAPQSAAATPGGTEEAIHRANSQFSANVRAGNATALADDYYAPDAVLMPPNVPAQRGRDAIRAYWTAALATGAFDVMLTSDDVMQSCSDLAVETGHYNLTATPKGATQAVHETG